MQIFPSRLRFTEMHSKYFVNSPFESPYSLPPLKNKKNAADNQTIVCSSSTVDITCNQLKNESQNSFIIPIFLRKTNFNNQYDVVNDYYQPKNEIDEKNKKDLREKNRLAVKRHRQKRDQYIKDLNSANYSLKREFLALCNQMEELCKENKVLLNEIKFFQDCMSKYLYNQTK